MPNLLDPDMAEEVQGYMKERGVQLKLNQKVTAINGKDNVESVTLTSGEEINANMVIVSAGARCNVELAKDAGLELGKLGLKVNQNLQTQDPDIYAGGDLIEYQSHVTGKPALGQLRPNAVIAGIGDVKASFNADSHIFEIDMSHCHILAITEKYLRAPIYHRIFCILQEYQRFAVQDIPVRLMSLLPIVRHEQTSPRHDII